VSNLAGKSQPIGAVRSKYLREENADTAPLGEWAKVHTIRAFAPSIIDSY